MHSAAASPPTPSVAIAASPPKPVKTPPAIPARPARIVQTARLRAAKDSMSLSDQARDTAASSNKPLLRGVLTASHQPIAAPPTPGAAATAPAASPSPPTEHMTPPPSFLPVTNAPTSALSQPVATMINQLFGPPKGSMEIVDHIFRTFENEGLEQMDDIVALSSDELCKVPGMRPAWARRIARYVSAGTQDAVQTPSPSGGGSNAAAAANATLPKSGARGAAPDRRASHRFLEGVQQFNRTMLRATPEPAPAAAGAEPNSLLENIKAFRRDSLRRAEITPQSDKARELNMDGFLGALLGAMRSRRILIDDVDFDADVGRARNSPGMGAGVGSGATNRRMASMSGDGDLMEEEWQ
jgi:hypothetical protein